MLDAAGAPSGADRRAPLFGRHEVAEEILRQLEATRDGDGGRILLLAGSGGVGKSTMLRAALDLAEGAGYQTIGGRALPTETPRPFGLVGELLTAAQQGSRRRDAAPPQRSSMALFAAVYDDKRANDPSRSTGLSSAAAEIDEADRLLATLTHPTERVDADRSSFYAQLTGFFVQLAAQRPLFLGLDDLSFADESSLEFLHRLGGHLRAAKIFILATCLPHGDGPARTAPAFDKLSGGANVATVRLRAMTEPELAEFVRWILNGRDPGRDAVMRWFTQTDGNPLFAEYLVRATTGFGAPPTSEAESSSPDLGELLKARIERLSEPERRALVHAAVLGKEFDFPTLDTACGQEEERLSENLERLVHDGLIREKGGEVYEFVSERTRVDVYSQLTETRRRLLHRKVARALRARHGVTDANLYELARQFYLGRDDPPAVELNRKAAEHAARAFAFDTTVVHLERALECQRRIVPRELPAEIRLQLELGRSLDELGDLPRSEEVLKDTVARARALGGPTTELALSLLGLARTTGDLALYPASRDLAMEAFTVVEGLGLTGGILAAHRALGTAYWRLGQLDEAELHQRAALELAEGGQPPAELGHVLIDLANVCTLRGPEKIAEAGRLYERASKIFEEVHDPSAQSRVLMNRGLLHHYAGEIDASLQVMGEALAAAERSRSPIWIGYCSLNLGQFYAELGETAKATVALDRAWTLLDPLGDQLARQQIVMIRGMVDEKDGRFERARERYHEALAAARQLSLGAETAEMQVRLAGLAERRGDLEEARSELASARGAGIESLRPDLAPTVRALAERLNGTATAPAS